MDEAVSAHVHYNAHHLFFSARLSALQEMPERYWRRGERRNSHLILWRGFWVCVKTRGSVIHQSLMKILRGYGLLLRETHSSSAGMNDTQPSMYLQTESLAICSR